MNALKEQSQKVVLSILEEHAPHVPVNLRDTANQVISDYEHGHFQLVNIGWDGDAFKYNVIFHFDIKPDGKIWIQVNRTDIDIAAELVERGVEKSDIVIGFQPPRYRPYTGYAVA